MIFSIQIPTPSLQINFSRKLESIRTLYLQEALYEAIEKVDIGQIDKELSELVPKSGLKSMARHGLRGELLFPVPILLTQKPSLLGYYRLLLGFSQKEFYSSRFGVSPFKSMEVNGTLSSKQAESLPGLSVAIIKSACSLLENIPNLSISKKHLDELTLLTLGSQLRGGVNNTIGMDAIRNVFDLIKSIVEHEAHSTKENEKEITLKNAAGREVRIAFSSDPDLIIQESMANGQFRNIIAIEIKGGKDFSNIHNRLGEAEKSHQKAKSLEYVECWTIVNVEGLKLEDAKMESPTTNRFYFLNQILDPKSDEHVDFKNRITSLIGLRDL